MKTFQEKEETVEIDIAKLNSPCHVFRWGDTPFKRSYCGKVLRCEQKYHGIAIIGNYGKKCLSCGNELCQECVKAKQRES